VKKRWTRRDGRARDRLFKRRAIFIRVVSDPKGMHNQRASHAAIARPHFTSASREVENDGGNLLFTVSHNLDLFRASLYEKGCGEVDKEQSSQDSQVCKLDEGRKIALQWRGGFLM
jgi:hypothetical protein